MNGTRARAMHAGREDPSDPKYRCRNGTRARAMHAGGLAHVCGKVYIQNIIHTAAAMMAGQYDNIIAADSLVQTGSGQEVAKMARFYVLDHTPWIDRAKLERAEAAWTKREAHGLDRHAAPPAERRGARTSGKLLQSQERGIVGSHSLSELSPESFGGTQRGVNRPYCDFGMRA